MKGQRVQDLYGQERAAERNGTWVVRHLENFSTGFNNINELLKRKCASCN